jgi:hypothetical protein
MGRIAFVLVTCGLLLGASECNEDEAGDQAAMPTEGGGVSGSGAGGEDTAGVKCGTRTCADGLVCCNASCGTCTAPGMFCTQIACDDGGGGGAGDPGGGGAGDPPAPSGPACGGIAGRRCPGAGSCQDDPSDSCDPRNGGADCGGVCECTARARCRAGQRWDASPEVCSCVGGDPSAGSGGNGEAGSGEAGSGEAGSGGSSGGETCGSMTCGDGETCCNATCGICTRPGEGCTKQLCPPEGEPQRCGGFAGFPCPGLGDCVDDPSDDCDPQNGGADCGGICKCSAGPTVLCQQGMPFNDDPHVCSCAPPPGSGGQQCGKNTCPDGQVCCNASCGICTPKGSACIQIACL